MPSSVSPCRTLAPTTSKDGWHGSPTLVSGNGACLGEIDKGPCAKAARNLQRMLLHVAAAWDPYW